MDMNTLTVEEFNEKIGIFTEAEARFLPHGVPRLLYLYTESCSGCKMVSPVLDKLEEKFKDKVNFFKADASTLPEFCDACEITTVPTIILLDTEGRPIMLTGTPTPANLEKTISEFIA